MSGIGMQLNSRERLEWGHAKEEYRWQLTKNISHSLDKYERQIWSRAAICEVTLIVLQLNLTTCTMPQNEAAA